MCWSEVQLLRISEPQFHVDKCSVSRRGRCALKHGRDQVNAQDVARFTDLLSGHH